jgi:hypothetical protein
VREEAFVNGYAYFLLLLMYFMYFLFCVFFMRVNEGRVLSKCSSEYYIIGIRTAQRCIETVKALQKVLFSSFSHLLIIYCSVRMQGSTQRVR